MFLQRKVTQFEQESQMLDINMANISSELSEMVVTKTPNIFRHFIGDQPQAIRHGFNATSAACVQATDVPYRQDQYQPCAQFTNMNDFHQSYENFYRTKSMQNLQPLEYSHKPLGSYALPSRMSSAERVTLNTNDEDSYKFSHNKRRASAPNTNLGHVALLCAAVDERSSGSLYNYPQLQHLFGPSYDNCNKSGARKKSMKVKKPKVIDFDNVVIDLSVIGLNVEGQESNEILRLFNLLHKINIYLNDQVPMEAEVTPMDYPNVFVKPQPLMPCTMNVQTQIKHVFFKCNNFYYRMLQKLDDYKFADHQKYFECNRCIFLLRKCVKHLEPFKSVEFEHRQGKFVNSFASAQAKNLEILLTRIISRIRECNIFIEVYRWSIQKNIDETGLPSIDTLKKAIAIASAIKNVPNTEEEEEERDNQKAVEVNYEKDDENDENNGNRGNGDNDGGFAAFYNPPLPQDRGRFVGC